MTLPVYVAIPVYNGARTIRKTLTNVLQQTFEDFQVLVYDDGSTDRTAQILGQMAARDSRISLLVGDQNLGRGAARNRLLEAAKDGIIAWQDADDAWNPTKLADQLKFFESFEELGIDPAKAVMISTFNINTTRRGQDIVTKSTPPEIYDASFVFSEDYRKCPFQLQATFGLASVYIEAGGFDGNLNWSEDVDIALRLLAHGSRIVSHRVECGLTTYHHSLAGVKGEVVEEAQQVIRDRHRAFARDNGVDIDVVIERRRLNYLFSIYLFNNNFGKALATTLGALFPGEEQKVNQVSRNIIAVFRTMLQAQEELSRAREAALHGSEPAAPTEGQAARVQPAQAAPER